MMDLPADDLSELVMDGIFRLAQSHDLDGIANGRKRIAQLVTEHRQEFIFTPVGVANPPISQRARQIPKPRIPESYRRGERRQTPAKAPRACVRAQSMETPLRGRSKNRALPSWS